VVSICENIISINKFNSEANGKVDSFQSELVSHKEQLDFANKKISELENQLSAAYVPNSNLEELKSRINVLCNEKEDILGKNQRQESSITSLQNTISSYDVELKSLSSTIEDLGKERVALREQIHQLEATIQSLTEELKLSRVDLSHALQALRRFNIIKNDISEVVSQKLDNVKKESNLNIEIPNLPKSITGGTTSNAEILCNNSIEVGADDEERPRLYTLSSNEYSELISKASRYDNVHQDAENSLALVKQQESEIEILRNSILVLTNTKITLNESPSIIHLHAQIEELKKAWSNQLSANSILRNLVSKTQAEKMVLQQDERLKESRLRAEFDEMINLFEDTHKEA
jgi:predicted  nucleic acid-binding Zn-ribbon protein